MVEDNDDAWAGCRFTCIMPYFGLLEGEFWDLIKKKSIKKSINS
jgi:hypothetical protein